MSHQQEDQIYDLKAQIKQYRGELDKLRAENSELRKLVEEAWTEALNSDRRGALNFEQWSEQHPILRYTEDLKDEQRSARHDAEEQP
jgi:regulator of replication initiation timing